MPVVRVGIVFDGASERNAELQALVRSEILSLTEGEFDVRFPDEAVLFGDWTIDGARANIDRLLEDPEVDLVIAGGILASHAVCCYVAMPKPVIAPAVIDADLQGLPYKDGASGVPNLNYVLSPDTLGEELAKLREVAPFHHVALLTNESFLEAVPELALRTRASLSQIGLDFEYVGVGRSADPVLEAISDDVDAVYTWPQLQLPAAELARLIAGLNQRRLPSFSALGGEYVEAGMLASLGGADYFPRLARRVALNTQRILLGEDAGSIPVAFSLRDALVINMATARSIGISPGWEVLIEAKLLNEEEERYLKTLSLAGVVKEAIEANLDIAAQRRFVVAGEQNVARSRSVFRPQVELSGLGLVIDEDRAEASFGSQAERSVIGSGTLSQLLYSDAAMADVKIQQQLQFSREFDLEVLRLDIALEAAVTYLNLLRAKSLVQIQRNNLELTRSNLELARIRRTIGAANPAEVFRWESQIATDRKALVEAFADRYVAEVAVNRLLHRRLEEPFLTAEVELEDPELLIGQERFSGYIETPRRYEVFRDFMVLEGLEAAPELKQLEAGIVAQERILLATRRAFWSPLVAVQATIDERLAEAGPGSQDSGFSLGTLPFEQPDESDWSIGLSASLPLFTGGSRKADRIQAQEELAQARLAYDSVAEKIEQRIRSAMLVARSSLTGIELARQAAEAARKNLDLVAEAYARGAVSIIDLLDAQNAALNADQLATNAIYDFFVDLMEVQRAANRFEFLATAEGIDAWSRRLESYFDKVGIPPLEP